MVSRQAHLNLLAATDCNTLLTSNESIQLRHGLQSAPSNFKILALTDLEYFLTGDAVENYPFDKSWEEFKNDPILIMHNSGTTGLPKPIRYTNYMISLFLAGAGTSLFKDAKMIAVMSPSWILGLTMYVHIPMTLGTIAVLPADTPHTLKAEYMDQIHITVRPDVDIYVLSLLRDLARNPEYIDHMRHMKMVGFGGAPLAREVKHLLSSFTNVQPAMGSTEVGNYGLKLSAKEDWMYYNFDPELGWRFLPFQHDLCESVIVRHADPEKAKTQMIFHVFPELNVYHTTDVWKPHLNKNDLWLYPERTDDFIKLRDLTKMNTLHVEGLILKDPRVKACVMKGEGKKVPFLLIELVDQETSVENATEELWPMVEGISKQMSGL